MNHFTVTARVQHILEANRKIRIKLIIPNTKRSKPFNQIEAYATGEIGKELESLLIVNDYAVFEGNLHIVEKKNKSMKRLVIKLRTFHIIPCERTVKKTIEVNTINN